MVSFFKAKPPPYAPGQGNVTLSRAQFATVFRTRPAFSRYVGEVGHQSALLALDNMFDEQLRSVPVNGTWSFGQVFPAGATQLKLADDAALATFIGAMEMFVDMEIAKIKNRRTYIAGLKQRNQVGSLYTELLTKTQPETDYYQAQPPRASAPGAPAIPPKPVDLEKGKAWLVQGVQGSPQTFVSTLARLRNGPTFPLGRNDQILRAAWQTLVPHAPAYRGWNNAASQQKYPSNIGGAKLLDELLADTGGAPPPIPGATAWYDLALFVYGAAMTAQPFTDGNKRACRLAYVLILGKGGVPFRAPTAAFGAALADMM